MNKLPFLSADSVAAPPPQPPSWVLITGGAARLGKALCLAFADAGWNVVLHYRHSHAAAQQVQALVQAKGQQCTLLQADLAQPHAAQQLLADCAMALGGQPLRCVVNNASQFEPDTAATAQAQGLQAAGRAGSRCLVEDTPGDSQRRQLAAQLEVDGLAIDMDFGA